MTKLEPTLLSALQTQDILLRLEAILDRAKGCGDTLNVHTDISINDVQRARDEIVRLREIARE